MSNIDALLERIALIIFIILYPPVMVWFVLYLNIGVWGWLVVALFLSPVVAVWYYVVDSRMKNYIVLLKTGVKEIDIEKAVDEYQKLIDKKKDEKE